MTAPVVAPAPAAPPAIPVGSTGETLVIGSLAISSIPGVSFVVEYGAKRKITEKAADGDDDATAVDGGREVRSVTIKLSWASTPAAMKRGIAIVQAFDPSQRNPPAPPAWAHTRHGVDLGAAVNVRNIVVKSSKGPNTAAGSGVETYELTCDSWAPTTPKTAKTEKGQKFTLLEGKAPAPLTNAQRGLNPDGTPATPPKVKP